MTVKKLTEFGMNVGVLMTTTAILCGCATNKHENNAQASSAMVEKHAASRLDASPRARQRFQAVLKNYPLRKFSEEEESRLLRVYAQDPVTKIASPSFKPEATASVNLDQAVTFILTRGYKFPVLTNQNIAEFIVVASDALGATERTKRKVECILHNTPPNRDGDLLAVEILTRLGAKNEITQIGRYHPDESVAERAINSLASNHKAVAEWLWADRRSISARTQEARAVRSRSGKLVAAVESTLIDLEDLNKKLSELEQRLAAEIQRVAELEKTRETQRQQLAKLEDEQQGLQKRLDDLQKRETELKTAVERQYQQELNRWNGEHITANGKSFQIVRRLSNGIGLKSNDRNNNFSLAAMQGELVLFVLNDGDLSEQQKAGMTLRLKRDRRNDSDANTRNPLRHGDVWSAQDNYNHHGTRFYAKHESGRTLNGSFYAVSTARPKPTLQYSADASIARSITEVNGRLLSVRGDAIKLRASFDAISIR